MFVSVRGWVCRMWVIRMLCMFVFKQKTAYEMRMSDWSSDVCSSDLGAPYECSAPERIRRFSEMVFEAGISAPIRTPRGRDIDAACGQLKTAAEKKTDRTSVVLGTRVSVRVDLGGRSIIKKAYRQNT